jgi:hypothetical protein
MNPSNPPSASSPPERHSRFFRWPGARRVLIVAAWCVTLPVLFVVEENWRGERAWHAFKKEMAASGETLELADLVPPPAADAENFAMTPFLAPLFDYRLPTRAGEVIAWRDTNAFHRVEAFGRSVIPNLSELPALDTSTAESERRGAAQENLQKLAECNPVLEELRAATRRPRSRFHIHYDELPGSALQHLALLKRLVLLMKARAQAELALDQPAQALDDIRLAFHTLDASKDEPILISQLVRIACLQLLLPTIQQGLATHQWNESQLAALEARLASFDFLAAYKLAIRGERVCINRALDRHRLEAALWEVMEEQQPSRPPWVARLIPSGWFYRNMIVMDRLIQELVLSPVDTAGRRVHADAARRLDQTMQGRVGAITPYTVLARLLVDLASPMREATLRKFARAQSQADQAAAVCALERYRLAHGQYPETLTALVPALLHAVPQDILTGKPLIYRPTGTGGFMLYSVGWNLTDESGLIAMTKERTPRPDLAQGDWVWGR